MHDDGRTVVHVELNMLSEKNAASKMKLFEEAMNNDPVFTYNGQAMGYQKFYMDRYVAEHEPEPEGRLTLSVSQ